MEESPDLNLAPKPSAVKEQEYFVSPAAGMHRCRPGNLFGVSLVDPRSNPKSTG